MTDMTETRMSTEVALVTGEASGMGRATVGRFLDRGFSAVIADLNEAVAGEARG